MRIIRDDELITITFDEKRSVLETKWKEQSFQEVEISTTREIIKEIAESLAKYHPDYYLADQTNRGVIYTVDIQQWVAETLVIGCHRGNVRKAAIIQPADFIVSLSNEQTINEVKNSTTAYQNFTSRAEALDWLGITE